MSLLNIRSGGMKERILMIAIAVSLVWHLFWLFAIKVVVTPRVSGAVKFSNVSFFGPAPQRGALEVRMAPSQRSFLEKRYLKAIEDVGIATDGIIMPSSQGIPVKIGVLKQDDRKLSVYVKEALTGSKLEPNFGME